MSEPEPKKKKPIKPLPEQEPEEDTRKITMSYKEYMKIMKWKIRKEIEEENKAKDKREEGEETEELEQEDPTEEKSEFKLM